MNKIRTCFSAVNYACLRELRECSFPSNIGWSAGIYLTIIESGSIRSSKLEILPEHKPFRKEDLYL